MKPYKKPKWMEESPEQKGKRLAKESMAKFQEKVSRQMNDNYFKGFEVYHNGKIAIAKDMVLILYHDFEIEWCDFYINSNGNLYLLFETEHRGFEEIQLSTDEYKVKWL